MLGCEGEEKLTSITFHDQIHVACEWNIFNHHEHISHCQPFETKAIALGFVPQRHFTFHSHFRMALMGVFDISFLVNMTMFKMFAIVPNTHI